MLLVNWERLRLQFRFEARTSRAVMHYKDTYLIRITDTDTGITGVGEAPLFAGLSAEDGPDYEGRLTAACEYAAVTGKIPRNAPSSVRLGLETALADLANGGHGIVFPGSEWLSGSEGIVINGLVWMGDKRTMRQRIADKLDEGFKCLKLKIGGIDFEEELELLRLVRDNFGPDSVELRLDANGAFATDVALERLKRLSDFSIHSIEQPIRAGRLDDMAAICELSPIPVALDEELIGDRTSAEMEVLLDQVRPQYIILKPALCGGFEGADGWIGCAEERGIGWWATSALESNIGLSAIAQWVALKNPTMPQGLGTGELYSNNIPSPLQRRGERLYYKS